MFTLFFYSFLCCVNVFSLVGLMVDSGRVHARDCFPELLLPVSLSSQWAVAIPHLCRRPSNISSLCSRYKKEETKYIDQSIWGPLVSPCHQRKPSPPKGLDSHVVQSIYSLLKYAIFHLFQELAPINIWCGVKSSKHQMKTCLSNSSKFPSGTSKMAHLSKWRKKQ